MSTEHMGSEGLSTQARERLSALADGEADAEDLQGALAAWRSATLRAGTCETWHAYHLIGDVMRSEDLARAGRDDAFLAGLRERLADEPVVVAPAPLPLAEPAAAVREQQAVANGRAALRRRRAWTAPVAAAAGVMAVAGVLVVTRLAPTEAPSPVLAQSPTAPLQAVSTGPAGAAGGLAAGQGAEPIIVTTANGPLVRDSRLEQYLSAHRQFGGSSALGVPSGFLRGATYDGANR